MVLSVTNSLGFFPQEKKSLQEETEQLSQTVKSASQQSERLSAQLKESMTRNAEELDARGKLEAKLEKVRVIV